MERIDLHTHSTCSDGRLTPLQLVAAAADRQVQMLALTDHDTVAGCDDAERSCTTAGIRFVRGCELSCEWRGREIHVLGLDIDVSAAALAAHLRDLQQLRLERLLAMGRRLDAVGIAGSAMAQGIASTGGSATRMHLARALVAYGVCADAQQAFDRWLSRGKPGYVPTHWPALDATVAVIVAAGGLPVLAHPHRYQFSGGGLRELCAQFKSAGGAGIEVNLAGIGPGDASSLASLARRYELLGSSGSDFHEPGIPWRPLGRFAKLADGIMPIHDELQRRRTQ